MAGTLTLVREPVLPVPQGKPCPALRGRDSRWVGCRGFLLSLPAPAQRPSMGPPGFSAGGLPNISVFRCSQTSLSLFLPPSNDCEAMLGAGVQRGATETQSRPRGPYQLMGAKGTKQIPPSTM